MHYKDRFGFTFEVLLTVKSDGYFVVNTTGTLIKRKTWDNVPVKPLINNVYTDSHICWGSAASIPSATDAFKVAVDCTEYFFSLAMNNDNCYINNTVRFINPKHHILAVLERRIPQIQEYYPKISSTDWEVLLVNISTFLDKKEITPITYLLLASMFDIDISLFDLK